MKKNYHFLALIAIAFAFSACNPLDKTYKDLGPTPIKTVPAQTITYTLATADYQILPTSVAANAALAFVGTADANQYIPTILNSKYGTYPDGSLANITYNTIVTPSTSTPQIKLADSVYNTTAFTPTGGTLQPTGLEYTLVNPTDYALYSKNNDLSPAQVLAWLPLKYTAPAANQLEVLTFILYPSIAATLPQVSSGLNVIGTTGTGSSAVTTATGSFIYLNSAWVQAYQISNAQYASIGKGQYNQFTASTDAANLVSYLNGLLKTDPIVSGTAAYGNTKYVSFNYYNNGVTPAVTSQRVLQLVYNGTNWVTGSVPAVTTTATATFTKAAGVWAGDPTVYYTVGGVGSADLTLLSTSGIGGSTLASDLASTIKYGDFDTYWKSLAPAATPNSFLNQAFILILTHDFPTPKVNVPYKVTFLYYASSKDTATTYSYTYDGTQWNAGQ